MLRVINGRFFQVLAGKAGLLFVPPPERTLEYQRELHRVFLSTLKTLQELTAHERGYRTRREQFSDLLAQDREAEELVLYPPSASSGPVAIGRIVPSLAPIVTLRPVNRQPITVRNVA